MITKRRPSIDLFRYVCALMVVAIHTAPFSDVNSVMGYIATQVLTRLGVPFFFAVSGYYYVKKIEKDNQYFFTYLKRILRVYCFWSVIYFIIQFILGGYKDIAGFLLNCLINFFILGSNYHFWYFPALIFSFGLFTLLYKLKLRKSIIIISLALYTIGCLGCSYYHLCLHIPGLSNLITYQHFTLIRRVVLMAFPFFTCGYLVHIINERYDKMLNRKRLGLLLCLATLVFVLEIIMVVLLNWQDNIILTFGLYSLLLVVLICLLKFPLLRFAKISEASRAIANFTYYSHPLFLTILTLLESVVNFHFTNTLQFFVVILITFVCGYALYKLDNKHVNKIL